MVAACHVPPRSNTPYYQIRSGKSDRLLLPKLWFGRWYKPLPPPLFHRPVHSLQLLHVFSELPGVADQHDRLDLVNGHGNRTVTLEALSRLITDQDCSLEQFFLLKEVLHRVAQG